MANNEKAETESFIYKGFKTHLVYPDCGVNLNIAFERIEELQELIDAQAPDTKTFEELKAKQTAMIQDYANNIGEINIELFQKNINYLVKSNHMKMSELELCLDISPGYISRTLNGNSNKKMSLDMAWKIAQVLGADLTNMLTIDMQNLRGNTALVLRFLDKLTKMTHAAEVEWQNQLGGARAPAEDCDLCNAGIIRVTENDETKYLIDAYDVDEGDPVVADIMSLPKFINGEEDLYIIPVSIPCEDNRTHFDFLAIKHLNDKEITWRKFIDIIEALDTTLDDAAAKLYSAISDQYFDVKFYDDHKNFIENFLK